MEGLSIEEKAKAYDEAIKYGQYLINERCKEGTDGSFHCTDLQKMFPELKESEDERVRKEMIFYFQEEIPQCSIQEHTDKMKEFIAWLEKQGNNMGISETTKQELEDNLNKALEKETPESCNEFLEKQGEQKPAMIQWKGDNLKEVIDFTGVYKDGFEKWFHNSWEEYEKYVHEHNNIFKIFNEDGSHIEVPVGAWIVKTPDGYNTASRYVFRQKPADKVEQKFKVGEWITNGDYTWQIVNVTDLDYILKSQNGHIVYDTISHVDEQFHSFIIEDAKDGDVIYSRHNTESFEWIGIFKSLDKENKRVFFYGFWHDMAKTFRVCGNEAYVLYDDFSPATKEQHNLLFQKMHDAGYEWDAEHKQLNKIEQKTAWSEEDEKMIRALVSMCDVWATSNQFYPKENKEMEALKNWLKSLKERVGHFDDGYKVGFSAAKHNQWRPSDEQTNALAENIEYVSVGCTQPILKGLLEDLKKLMEE